VRFGILGPLEVEVAGRVVDLGPPKQRAVLALLLIERERVVSLDRLIDQLWDGEPPPRATASLQAYLSNLRRVLEPDRLPRSVASVLVTSPPGYVLRVPASDVDAAVFEDLAGEGARLLAGGRADEARRRLDEALALWRGPALADFAFDAFAEREIVRLEELRVSAVEDRLAAELDGDGASSAGAISRLEVLVREHPLRERPWGLLMLALYRSGRQAEALRAYQSARRALAAEIGVEPGPQLRRLEADILAHAPSLERPSAQAVPEPRTRDEEPDGAVAAAPSTADHDTVALHVGRRDELERLASDMTAAGAGSGRVVLVTGEAGIGKTRLVDELVAMVGHDAVVTRGEGYEGGVAPPFWPWVQVLRGVCERADPGDVHDAVERHRTALRQLIPELVGGVDLDAEATVAGEATRFGLFEAVAGFLLRTAQNRPLMIILDDLHWVDGASLELVTFLASRLAAARVLFIGTYREREPFVGDALREALAALARVGVDDRIELRGLPRAEVEELVRRSTGGAASPEVIDDVHRRTGGNPFFVGELVRLLTSERRLGDLLDQALHRVPQGVRDVIGQRMARLPEQTNALLTLAAVIGVEFDMSLLEAAAGLDPDVALDAVEAAVVSGLLLEDPKAPGRFRFSHALVQETVYEELTALRRARLHARVAGALEDHGGDDEAKHLADLAHHYFRAVAAGEAENAVLSAMRAADAAFARLGYEAAEAHLERAQQALATLPRSQARDHLDLDVQIRLMRVLGITRGYSSDEMERACDGAQALSLELGETSELAQVLWSRWGVHIGLAEFAAATRTGQQLLELGRGNDDPIALLGGLQALGATAVHEARLDDGRRFLEEAIDVADRLDDPSLANFFFQHPVVFARSFLALAEWLVGEGDRSRELAEEAVLLAERLTHPFTLTLALLFDGWLGAFRRDAATARERSAAAEQLAVERGFTVFAPMAAMIRAWGHAHGGDPSDAVGDGAAALAALDASRTRMVRHFFLALQAEVQWASGDAVGALETVDAGIREVRDRGERFYESELHRLRGTLLLAGRPVATAEALDALTTAVRVARELGAVALEARATESLRAAFPDGRAR
jgi:DNA-binding SARP family transcriptional activator